MDEVPTRAPDFIVSLSVVSDIDLTANLSPALTRGAGEGTVSAGSRCPRRIFSRRGSARRGTPPTPPHKAAGIRDPGGDGLRPAGAREGEHSLAVGHSRQRFARRYVETNAPIMLSGLWSLVSY